MQHHVITPGEEALSLKLFINFNCAVSSLFLLTSAIYLLGFYAVMRERITFLHAANDPFDPQQLRVENDTLHVSSLVAAREDRLTFSLYELPQEVGAVLSKENIYICIYILYPRWLMFISYGGS